ncbi:glycosyltransferase family 4 protein [Noviherbaspirillum soli]|uniref:glycosyltransferase family 4 protein n=1 Tax=Noviherbaspirillum soli TaxID=1064518 RepID=UPI00188B2C09|nr:glycosyltransferase family 4 protein [Noviherbaspirillum soli]
MTVNIAMIEPVGGHGGMDYYDFGLCNGISSANANVVLYTSDKTSDYPNAKFLIKKWYVGIYGATPKTLRGILFLLCTLRIFFDILRRRISIVHFHFFDVGFLQLILLVLAKTLRKQVIVTVHDVEGFVEGKGSLILAKIAYRLPNHIIVHNDFTKNELMSLVKRRERSVHVIAHGNYEHIYSRTVDKFSARDDLGLPHNSKIILFFGQIKNVKRLDLLLEAFAKVVMSTPNVLLVVAGKVVDVPFAVYEEKIQRLKIEKNLVLKIRYIENYEVPNFYSSADLVVLPYERIYQSGVLLMAMTFRRAVVVSDIPGMLDIVKSNQTGYVFKSGSVESLSQVLLKALSEEEERKLIAVNGSEYVKKEHSWESIGRATLHVYMSLSKNRVVDPRFT